MKDVAAVDLGDRKALDAKLKQVAADVLAYAKAEGASSAEVGSSIDAGFSVNVRMGEVETLEYNRDKYLGLTVYFGQRKGSASTSDLSTEALKAAVKAACHIARVTSEDECSGLADADKLATEFPNLDLYHPWGVTPEQAIDTALQCETIARDFDKRIINSEGACVSSYQGMRIYANSLGFVGGSTSTRHNMSCVLIAGDGNAMQRDYSYTVARDPLSMEKPETIAKQAAERTIARLGARTVETQRCPVIFVKDVAGGIIGSLFRAISGGNIYRKSSFLLDHVGQQVFPEHIQIDERPHLPRALGSACFDSEGVATRNQHFIKDGVLQQYVLGSYSARKLGLQTTGNAGGVHNIHITTSDSDLQGLIKEMGRGLVVTEMMGQGVSIVTGDYSRGASGFWVENGEIQYPVHEVTIASNLKEMYRQLVKVGNDVETRGNVRTGSLLIAEMTVGGA